MSLNNSQILLRVGKSFPIVLRSNRVGVCLCLGRYFNDSRSRAAISAQVNVIIARFTLEFIY